MQITNLLDLESISQLQNSFQSLYNNDQKQNLQEESEISSDAVVNISNTSKIFNKLDSFLNLGRSESLSTDELSSEEREEFMSMLSTLLKEGVVGYEILEVDGQREKHFIVTQIGNERTYGAGLYDDSGEYI